MGAWLMGGCLVGNLPSTARPLGAGDKEISAVMHTGGSKRDDANSTEATFGGAGGPFPGTVMADLSLAYGVTDSLDVGIKGGPTGTIEVSAKQLLLHAGPLYLAVGGNARTYWVETAHRMLSGAIVATLGEGRSAFTFGGFAGYWWGVKLPTEDASDTVPMALPYFGGGMGFETYVSPVQTRVMAEVHRYDVMDGEDGAWAGLLTVTMLITEPARYR